MELYPKLESMKEWNKAVVFEPNGHVVASKLCNPSQQELGLTQ